MIKWSSVEFLLHDYILNLQIAACITFLYHDNLDHIISTVQYLIEMKAKRCLPRQLYLFNIRTRKLPISIADLHDYHFDR